MGLGWNLWSAFALGAAWSAFLIASRRRYRALPRIAVPEQPDPAPDCMVVIPARDEAKTIARAIASLPPDSVIVADDHSSDDTAKVASGCGAGVIPAPPLPRNGIGKSNACAAAARALTSRWVLFADADTWYEKDFLASAVACAEASGLSFLSILLQPECKTFAERVLVPYARALFFCGASPAGNPNALFSGQCLLVRREPYLFIGGHHAVVPELVEDVRLTALAQRHRMNLAVARGDTLGHARLYTGFRGIWSGIERHAFRFMLVSPWIGISI
ncbi:MAG TPA: glycosyltransferase family 2 protein, partial [Bryobacteraceae bacterium]|nr:glycosyltransferase family 2 protein [Bryobacteraceae bacterium]